MGEPSLRTHVQVVERALDPAHLYRSVQDQTAGAAVLFSGVVRNHAPGRTGITHLEYEAYTEQVESKIATICAEARERWDITHLAVEHRLGKVDVGDESVVVAVSSSHRAEAFAAARYVIDELKQRAPIWKKEFAAEGAEWVRGA